jgi:hypothetical protein
MIRKKLADSNGLHDRRFEKGKFYTSRLTGVTALHPVFNKIVKKE